MKRWPTQFDVISAERQLANVKREAGERIAQVRSAVRSRLTQPSTLFVVTSLGALLGARFARRNETRARQEAVSVRAPIVGLVYTTLIRFGLQHLAHIWSSPRTPDSATAIATVHSKP